MAEMDPPYHEMRAERVGAKIRQAAPPTLKNIRRWSTEFSDILSCCLKRNPMERITCQELKQHPFMLNTKYFIHLYFIYLKNIKQHLLLKLLKKKLYFQTSQVKLF